MRAMDIADFLIYIIYSLELDSKWNDTDSLHVHSVVLQACRGSDVMIECLP